MAVTALVLDRFLRTEEELNNPSQIEAGIYGIASGLIRVPAGVVSFGADLIDAGFDTEIAAKFEKIVDEVDPFDEVAEKKALGQITQGLTQVGTVAKLGADVAGYTVKSFSKAMKAKRAGKYGTLTNPNVRKGAAKALKENKKAGFAKYAVGITGAAAGETFVFDVENIGTLGDAFGGGPTELDREPVKDDPSKDALRRLMNRAKFGSESLLLAPFVYGIGQSAKFLAKRGKDLVSSDSKVLRTLDKFGALFRSRGRKPQEIFEAKRLESGREMLDSNRAVELVRRIDEEIDHMFPATKTIFNTTNQKSKKQFLKDLNDAMFSGDLKTKMDPKLENKLYETMFELDLPLENQNRVIRSVYGARQKFTELLDIATDQPGITKVPGMGEDLKTVMGDRVKDYLGNTYKIFEDKSVLPFASYKPAAEKITKVKEIFKRYAAKNGQDLTDEDADYIVNDILKSAREGGPGQLPTFKYLNLTEGAKDPRVTKTFERIVDKGKFARGEGKTVIGPGSKAFRELFGNMEDARYSIYNGMSRLSSIARKNQMFNEIVDLDEALKAEGRPGFFYVDEIEARNAFPNQTIVALDDYPDLFKGGNLVNRLGNYLTSKDIAEGLLNSQKVSQLFRGESKDVNPFISGVAWGYRNLVLYPKGVSQIAKTVLSPITHFRNFFSAGAFAGANGIFFTNPKVLKDAFKKAYGNLQIGLKPEADNEAYRELLELGVVNSNVRIGDLKALLKDVKFGEGVSTDNVLRPMIGKLSKLTEKFQDLYVAEDDFWKITNYAVELDRLGKAYSKAGITKTSRELKEEAADIVKNTVPNYAYVSDFVRGMRTLPIGNFLSFPTEIIRTTANMGARAIKEINDPALASIGWRRLFGMGATLGAVPAGFVAGFQGLSNTDDEELEAMRKFVPSWSKNSVILPMEVDGEKFYIDFSHANAYDTASRPFTTLIREVQKGVENEDALIKGLTRGLLKGLQDLVDPFISEAMFTEAVTDILVREGQTREGKKLYTDQTPPGDKLAIAINHVLKTTLPFSPQQFQRLGKAATGAPGARGETYEIPYELAGFFGMRPIKLDPIKSMGFKISEYQAGLRNARREFTGGEYGVVKGGPKTPNEVITQFFKANKATYDVQKEMYENIRAAQILGASPLALDDVFEKRGVNKEDLENAVMNPYFPSEGIQDRFSEIEQQIGQNPFQVAYPTLLAIENALSNQRLDEPFMIELDEFLEPEPLSPQSLAPTPMPNPQVIATQPSVMQTGLTPTENALLSEEEKAIKLKQRGIG